MHFNTKTLKSKRVPLLELSWPTAIPEKLCRSERIDQDSAMENLLPSPMCFLVVSGIVPTNLPIHLVLSPFRAEDGGLITAKQMEHSNGVLHALWQFLFFPHLWLHCPPPSVMLNEAKEQLKSFWSRG